MKLQLHLLRLFCLLALPTTAFADVEFYTYGGFRPIVNAFTNLAVIFDSEDYLVFGFVVAIIGVTVGMLVKSGLAALGKATSKDALAILFLAMFGTALFGALFEPKTTVHIYDPTHNQYESVGDIPLALAFIASGTNLLERFATDTVSDGIGFGRTRHANGKSLELMFNILGGDPVSHNIYISKSIERYFKGCVVAAAANSDTFSGFDYNAVLNGTADIWTELARTRDSDQRFLWFNQANPGGIVMNCEEGYDNIRDVLLNPDTFTTYIENACIKSGYESDTPEGILDCTDLIEETVPLIFSGSVDTSPENIAGMATLANGLYMTLAETPGSAITSIGNMKQMSQGYGSTIIAEGWLPSMRSATLVIIFSFTPLIILMIFTPFVFRALHMLSALFLFLTIWGASDAIIHVVIVDNVMSMLAEVKTFEGGLRSFLTAPSELQKSIAMFGKMQSLGVMFAGLMTAFYFKFSSMQFANMGEKLANDIDSTGQQVGNEVINPINRMETMRQAASSAGHYNLMAQVGPELMGTAIQQTATWSDSSNAYSQQKLGELGFSPQQAITGTAQNRAGEIVGSLSARNERALSNGSNILDTATDMSRISQLTGDAQTNYNQEQMSRLNGPPVLQADTVAGIQNASNTAKLSQSKDVSDHVTKEIATQSIDFGRSAELTNRFGDIPSMREYGETAQRIDIENNLATNQVRDDRVASGHVRNREDLVYQTTLGSTDSALGNRQSQLYATETGMSKDTVDAATQPGISSIRGSTASNIVAQYIGAETGRGALGQEVENQKYSSENIAALNDVRALASQVEEESSFNIAKEQNSKIDKAMTTDDLRSWNSLHPGEFQQPFPGTVSMVVDTDEPNSTPTNIAYATGDQDTYSSDASLYKDIGNTIKTGTDEEIAGIVNTANTEPKLMNLAESLIAARAVSRSAQESESSGTEVKGGASAGIYGNIPVSAIPVIGPLISGAQKATQIVSSSGTKRGKSKGLDAGVSARANVGVGGSSTDTSSDTGTVNVNRGQAVDDIVSLQKSLQNEDSNARTQAIAAFREKYSKDIADDLEYQKAVTQKSDPAMMDDYKSGLTGDISQMMESAREFTENVQNGVDDLTNKITDFVGNESVKR